MRWKHVANTVSKWLCVIVSIYSLLGIALDIARGYSLEPNIMIRIGIWTFAMLAALIPAAIAGIVTALKSPPTDHIDRPS